jgi:hypothetical protein
MAPAILDRCSTVSEDLVDFWTLIAFGSASAVKRRYGVNVQAYALLRNPQIAKLIAAAEAERLAANKITATRTLEAPQRPSEVDGGGNT